MSHLFTERLAALADEQPTADELAHLAMCAECARELDAHRMLLAMAGSERDTMGPPLTRWESLSPRLRADGLIVGRGQWAVGLGGQSPPASRWYLHLAAALLLVAGGTLLGRYSANVPVLPGGLTGAESTQAEREGDNEDALVPAVFASVEEAKEMRDRYRLGYQRAVAYLSVNDSSVRTAETPAVMKARLSALDRVYGITREALYDAPYDPVINDFYLNSFGQREATLRELNTVLPQNVRLNSF